MRAIFLAAALLVGLVPASAAPFVNGSFELGPSVNDFTSIPNGGTTLTGWLVGGAGVDYIGNYWVASDGVRSLDLNGAGTGTVSQTFDTTVGFLYTVTFDLSGNAAGSPLVKQVQVAATGGSAQNYSFDTTGNTIPNITWVNQTYNFTATSASTTLSFTSLTSGAFGPALDNVRVSFVPPTTGGGEVPEPTTFAMMGAGAALMFAASRRRRK